MNIVAIVQARLGSTRLPGKVLLPILGKPMIRLLVERLQLSHHIDKIIVAVPQIDEDFIGTALHHDFCEVVGVPGNENNVYGRFKWVLSKRKAIRFIRVCADSPLLDPNIIDWMCEAYHGGLMSNVQPRTFPAGQCVEIMETEPFMRGNPTSAYDREHVMPWFYKHHGHTNMACPFGDFSTHSMVVDTPEDFERIKAVVEKMDRAHWSYGWQELVEMMA